MELKEGIEAAVERVRQEVKDELARRIVDEPGRSYESLAREFNVSLGFVYRLARERGIRRDADKCEEVVNG